MVCITFILFYSLIVFPIYFFLSGTCLIYNLLIYYIFLARPAAAAANAMSPEEAFGIPEVAHRQFGSSADRTERNTAFNIPRTTTAAQVASSGPRNVRAPLNYASSSWAALSSAPLPLDYTVSSWIASTSDSSAGPSTRVTTSSAGSSSGVFRFGQRRILTPARAAPSSTLFVFGQPIHDQPSQEPPTALAAPSEAVSVHNTWTSADDERMASYERRAESLDRLNGQPFDFVPPPMPTLVETVPMEEEEVEEDAEDLFSQID